MIPTASSASLHVHLFCSSLINVALEEVSYVFDYGERDESSWWLFRVLLFGVSLIWNFAPEHNVG